MKNVIETLKNDPYVNFLPFVGEKYEEGIRGKKILVLGESHYCGDLDCSKCPKCERANMQPCCRDITKDVMHEYIINYSGEKYEQTFLCFERAFSGKVLKTQEEREEFWNHVAFYNYIQNAQSGPRRTPHIANPEDCAEAFKTILETLMPDAVIVWGDRLYKVLPDWGGTRSELQLANGDTTPVWTYTIKGKQIPAMAVPHPSCPRGKNRMRWYAFYEQFI